MNESFEPALLGDERLDAQHRQIVRRLRNLAAAVDTRRTDEVRIALRILSLALAEHWRDEDRLIAEVGYPGIREHARHHAELTGRIARALEPGASEGLSRAAVDISLSVEEHMRSEDLRLARFFAARANLKSMAEGGPILTPIPGTFEAVSPAARTPAPLSLATPLPRPAGLATPTPPPAAAFARRAALPAPSPARPISSRESSAPPRAEAPPEKKS